MFSYIYKPVQVQAVQYSTFKGDETAVIPAWLMKAILDRRIYVTNSGYTVLVSGPNQIKIEEGDWIVFDPFVDEMWIQEGEEFQRRFERDNRDGKATS
ncbi:hypothetical protein EVC27_040 [Rhizobium phage RHph_I1_6]|uniref:Uncharacterized protein n=1 Tax=Rhizobium phage RHph_I1_6 TaxID=2509728 RepID=A0A7S5RFJ7_9CAUD|nr:hypothetical protein PP745_gp040 [Rhizobium phage RHph_I1_6]QIG76565.1 hypothetical protein EVC27_040 [Rhizobium phage RHph_I1_6]